MVCVLCGSDAFDALAEPHPYRSVLSDLRVVEEPLAKSACRTCGLIGRRRQLLPEAVFDERYELHAHAPGQPEEMLRQRAYADWLAPYFNGTTSVYEAGAGNGSLLLALSAVLQQLCGSGVEPAAE